MIIWIITLSNLFQLINFSVKERSKLKIINHPLNDIAFVYVFQACVLMNNIQQTRIQLEKTYESMGGQELEEDAAGVLNQLQSKLNKDIDELARIFAHIFNRRVDVSVMAMGKLLYEVKGGGHGQAISKSEVQAAADGILQPLMDLLDGER